MEKTRETATKKGSNSTMAEDRAVLEIERQLEHELSESARTERTQRAELSRPRPILRAYAATGDRGVSAVSTPSKNAAPILLTMATYAGAVCAAVWASLNLLHWFWRQLQ